MKINVWDSSVPVEKSAYLCGNDVSFFNIENFQHDPSKLTMLDLFCGAGGFAVGCSWAGFESVFGVDYFEPAMETWCENHKHSIGCLGDIRKIDPKKIKDFLLSKGVSHINMITGGVPCQGFSRANRKHNDNDERNFLFLEYIKYVDIFKPDCIILENVSGMRSTAGGHFENEIKKQMELLDYTVTISLLQAADFGVPQFRSRLIFVGIRNDSGLKKPFVFPKGTFTPSTYRTVQDAFSDLPELLPSQKKSKYKTEPMNDYQAFLRGCIKEFDIDEPKELFNHAAPNHPLETIRMIKNTPQGKPMYEKFKQRIRLNLKSPSPTQLAGGIRPSFQFGHPIEARGLSTRERARIQSFPDSYIFKGGIVQERVQTGNAVPPLLIYNIAKILKSYFDERIKNV